MSIEQINWEEIDQEFTEAIEAKLDIKSQPDSVFALVYTDPKTKMLVRKFPLIIPGNRNASASNVYRAVHGFWRCPREHRSQVAKKILSAMEYVDSSFKERIRVSEKSKICKYIDIPKKFLYSKKVIIGPGISYTHTHYY